MEREINFWYKRKVTDENDEEWKKLTVLEKEALFNLGNEKVLVCQYHHPKADRRWITVVGFVVGEDPERGYGMSREYLPGEKEEIIEAIKNSDSFNNIDDLESKIYSDVGGKRI